MLPLNRKVKGWALYYWGNHAFTTSIVTVFFPIFFKDYWNHGVDVSTSTFRLGLANSGASLIVALSAWMRAPSTGQYGRCHRVLG